MTGDLDKDLLHEIGFPSQAKLKAFLQKVNTFFHTLTPAEQKAFRATLTDFVDAARSFRRTVTPAELREFLEGREPDDAPFTMCLHGTNPPPPPQPPHKKGEAK